MGKKELDLLPNNLHELSEEEAQQIIIDTFYPGLDYLTANEVALFADEDLDTLHKYQLEVAIRRTMPEYYKDNSKIVGCTVKEAKKHFDDLICGRT